jgi:bifunctional DNA-binding transcriptional regulator/antitoxin component of YhaV-PrlF toxin-antitoxin module
MISYLENNQRERKIISVSKKRQITIPQKYFEALGLGNEVECVLQEDSILERDLSRVFYLILFGNIKSLLIEHIPMSSDFV